MDGASSIFRLIYEYPAITLAAGVLIWLLGWKIYKGFIIVSGAFIGAFMAYRFSHLVSLPDWMLMLAGALLGAALALFAVQIAFFFLGVALGYDIVYRFAGQHVEVLGLFIGIALGLAFIVLFSYFIVIATSYTGSLLILYSSMVLLGFSLSLLLREIALLLLTVVGVVMQYSLWGKPRIEEPEGGA